MRRSTLVVGWVAVALLGATLLRAGQPARAADDPQFDFESDAQGWASPSGGSLSIARDAGQFKVGTGSLQCDYDPTKGEPVVARTGLMVKDGSNSLDFWLRTSESASLEVFLVERGGAIYFSEIAPTANSWGHYRLALSDFLEGEARDPNGQLDADQITAMYIQDLSRYQVGNANLPARKLWLDAVSFLPDVVDQRHATRPVDKDLEVLIDDFDSDLLGWNGNLRSKLDLRKVDGRSVLTTRLAVPSDAPERLQLTNRFDRRYSRAKAFRLVARSPIATRIYVQIREWDGTYEGPDYQAAFEIPGGKEWQTITLPIPSFKVTDRKADSNGKLDLDSVWLMLVGDSSEPAGKGVDVDLDSFGVLLAS